MFLYMTATKVNESAAKALADPEGLTVSHVHASLGFPAGL